MSASRGLGLVLATVALVVASRNDAAPWAGPLRYAVLAYFLGDIAFRVRSGYLRRRPHWTRDSWRRYLAACAVPVGALLLMVGLMFVLEARPPFVGEPKSALRGAWVAVILVFMLIGTVGFVFAMGWLESGEATQQFQLPRWLRRTKRDPA